MDQTLNYAEIMQRLMREEEPFQPLHGPRIVSACDISRGQFLLLAVGMQGQRHIDNILFHAQLLNGKVIIETDNTEDGLKTRLLEAGIRPEDFLSERETAQPDTTLIAA
ncbi:MAG: element excision factor XisI family protein [Blastocatellia bacterium]